MARIVYSNFEILDCGDVDGARYQVEAIASDLDDTSRVASAHIASCFDRSVAEMIVKALGHSRVSL